MFEFAQPWSFLWLLLLLPLLWYVATKKRMPTIKLFSVKPFKATSNRTAQSISRIPLILYGIAGLLIIFALARPRKGTEHMVQRANGIDIMLALDLSGSMNLYDYPKSLISIEQIKANLKNGNLKPRIDVAKQEIKKFIEKRPNDRIGLIAFADKPYTVCPPTLDHTFLLSNLQRLKAGMIGDSTGIASPIASSVVRLQDAPSKRKVLVLFTDGKNMVKGKLTPRIVAQLAKTKNVVIYTVGIGSKRAFIIQDTPFGRRLEAAEGQFDEPLLRDIAKVTGGKYYRAKNMKGLRAAMNDINKIEKTSTEQPRYMNYKEWAPFITMIAIAIFLLGFILEHTIWLKIP